MGIGGGIALIVLGLILLMHVIQIDVPYVNESTLGILLVLGGVAAVALALTVWRGRPAGGRVVERQVVERDVDDPRL